MSPSWKIYEWDDGSHVSMIHAPNHRPKFMLIPSRKPSCMRDFASFSPEPGPPIHLLLQLKDVVNSHFSDSVAQLSESEISDYRLQEKKLVGFALDLGIQKNIFFQGIFETGDWGDPSVVLYPKFVPDERLEQRQEEAMEMWGDSGWPSLGKSSKKHFLGCIHGLQMEASHDQIRISWDVNGGGNRRTISRYRPRFQGRYQAPATREDLKLITREMIDDVLRQEGSVLPESSREEWERGNVLRGRLLIPSPEEVEVFRILDEPLPFFWEDDALVQWLDGQAST